MSVIIGALLDVSGSMKDSIGNGFDVKDSTWAHSIFRVADDIARYDVSESTQVFILGLGAKYSEDRVDIISTIKHCNTRKVKNKQPRLRLNKPASYPTVLKIYEILEREGAHTIRRWASIHTVQLWVSEYIARIVLRKLIKDEKFARKFVTEYLPPACRREDGIIWSVLKSVTSIVVTPFLNVTQEDIEEVLAKALIKGISRDTVYTVKAASNILHGRIEERDLNTKRVRELYKLVEPFFFGYTPLYSAINDALNIFKKYREKNVQKLLFIVSDGQPTDEYKTLKTENVTVVSCYISKSSCVKARKLHSVPNAEWENGAKFLFNLSSFIPTSLITRAIFIKNKWKIDITNNETRLFMHVNHPDNLKDVCKLARNAVCCQDSLSELLVSVKLDIYINDKNSTVKVYDQGGDGTCYAHASATVLHLAMHRILGHNGGYPTFEALRKEIVTRHGKHGANTYKVLQDICPLYRLRCRTVDVKGAMEAITEKRPVVVTFRLTDKEWDTFFYFFGNKPHEILKQKHLDINGRRNGDMTRGHAVVFTSFNSKYLQLMNSWGDKWADSGFFKVQNASVLGMEFIDVFWDEGDFSFDEKKYYKRHGTEVAGTLMKSLKALKRAKFTCPECKGASYVNEFSGTLTRVCCPRCEEEFSSYDGNGNLLALNIYLTSLSR